MAENWPAKVISIALALVLFVFHHMSNLSERFFSVPLLIESQASLVPSSPYPRTIRITLRGNANSIYPIIEEDIQAFIDLSRFETPGNYQAVVQIRKRGTALDVTPLEIRAEPGEFPLLLDNRTSKFVPLVARIQGEVESGYVFNSYMLNPPQVTIDGPSGIVDNISELYTDIVLLNNRSVDFTETVNILNHDPLIVIRGAGVTEFRGYVSRVIHVRNIHQVPVMLFGLGGNFYGEPDIRFVSVQLESENNETLENFIVPEDFLRVDCSEITEAGVYVLDINARVPSDIAFSINPPEVSIVIRNAGGRQ